MKTLLLILLFCPIALRAQVHTFSVETIETNASYKENGYYKLEHYTPYFFEDENYIVTSECRGEFGGEIYFKNKKSNVTTAGLATCPVIINKLGSTYYLTTSLLHGSGFFKFAEIVDPEHLTVKVNDSTYYSDYQLNSGMKTLTGGMGKTILLSFVFKSQIYHIVSDHDVEECYIAIQEKAALKKIQFLSKLMMKAYSIDALVTKDGHYATKFSIREGNRLRDGYIDVFADTIKIYLCK